MNEQNLYFETTFQLPPPEILQLADFTPAPFISLDMRYEYIIYLYRDAYKTLDDLMQPEIRLAGRRVNPNAHISSSADYISNLKIGKVDSPENVQVQGNLNNIALRIRFLRCFCMIKLCCKPVSSSKNELPMWSVCEIAVKG